MDDHVYVRIMPKKSTLRWTSCAKLAPVFYGPFQILEILGAMAYRFTLPSHIRVHNLFHVSTLKRYVHDPRHVIHWWNIQVGIRLSTKSPKGMNFILIILSLSWLQVESDDEFLVEPQCNLGQREIMRRRRAITQVKVQWKHFGPEEATWEDEIFVWED